MDHQSYLIFEWHQSRYGVATSEVQELFFLPDITPIVEAPTSVIGVINLRGRILPIINLQQHLQQPSLPYQLTDSVVILQWQNQQVGIIVNQVYDVQTIAPEQIQSTFYRQVETDAQCIVIGITYIEEMLVTLLNSEWLVQSSMAIPQRHANITYNGIFNDSFDVSALSQTAIADSEKIDLFAHLSLEARQILRERSNNLRQTIATQDAIGIPIVVMGLNGEYFGLALETVYEFTDIRKITPIPCCPSHILGNMNLRGEIVTLIDISQSLNLTNDTSDSRQKAIVVRQDELTAGIAVDDIFDVLYLNPAQISTAPVSIRSTSDNYLQGVAVYRNRLMSIINLSKMLAADALVVNEEV